MKKLLAILLSALICLAVTGCCFPMLGVEDSSSEPLSSSSVESELQSEPSSEDSEPVSEDEPVEPSSENTASDVLTLGSTFTFDDLEISLGNETEFVVFSNEFSEYHGESVVRIPVTIKNISEASKSLNMFYVAPFGSKGTQLDSICLFFDDDILNMGEIRPGASMDGYLHMLYDGDGDYYIEFDNFFEKLEVKIPVQKSE